MPQQTRNKFGNAKSAPEKLTNTDMQDNTEHNTPAPAGRPRQVLDQAWGEGAWWADTAQGSAPESLDAETIARWERRIKKRQQKVRRDILGARAPVRRRRKRVAKKIAKRGGRAHYRIPAALAAFYRAWPEMQRYVQQEWRR
jgi:hypothetical protein